MLAENRRRQMGIDFFRIDIFELPVEYEIIAFDTEANSRLLSQKNEGKYVSILRTASVASAN